MSARVRHTRRGPAPVAVLREKSSADVLSVLQRGWWLVGLVGAMVAMLGFQALSPSRRLAVVEQVNARQDSMFAAQTVAQQRTLDTIRRQLSQLIAGQCAKERDRMARLLYGCPQV